MEKKGFSVEKDERGNRSLFYEGKYLEKFSNEEGIEIFGGFSFVDSKLRFFKTEFEDFGFEKANFSGRWKFDSGNRNDLLMLAQIMYNREEYTSLDDFSMCAANLSQEILSYDPLSEHGNQIWRFSKAYRSVIDLLQNMTAENDLYLHRVPKDVINYKILPFLPELDIFLTDEARMLVEAEKLRNLFTLVGEQQPEIDEYEYGCLFDESKPIKLYLGLVKIRKLVSRRDLDMTEIGENSRMSEWIMKDDLVKSFRYFLTLGHETEPYVLNKIHEEILRFCLYLNDGYGHFNLNPMLECLDPMLTNYERNTGSYETKDLCDLLVQFVLEEDVYDNEAHKKRKLKMLIRSCKIIGTSHLSDMACRKSYEMVKQLIDHNDNSADLSDIFEILNYLSMQGSGPIMWLGKEGMVVELAHKALLMNFGEPEAVICISRYLDGFLGDRFKKDFPKYYDTLAFELLNTIMRLCLRQLNSDEIKKMDNYDEISEAVEKTRKHVKKLFMHSMRNSSSEILQMVRCNGYKLFSSCMYHVFKLQGSSEERKSVIDELSDMGGGILLLLLQSTQHGNFLGRDIEDPCSNHGWSRVFELWSIILEGVKDIKPVEQLSKLLTMAKTVRGFVGTCDMDEMESGGDYAYLSTWPDCFRFYDSLIEITERHAKSPLSKSVLKESGLFIELEALRGRMEFVYDLFRYFNVSGTKSNDENVRRFCHIFRSLMKEKKKKKIKKKDEDYQLETELKYTTRFLIRFFCLLDERKEKVGKVVLEELTSVLLSVICSGFPITSVSNFMYRNESKISFNEQSLESIQRICDSPPSSEVICLVMFFHTKIPDSSCPALLSSLFSALAKEKEEEGEEKVARRRFRLQNGPQSLCTFARVLLGRVSSDMVVYERIVKDFLSHEYCEEVFLHRSLKNVIEMIMKFDEKINEDRSHETTQLWKNFFDVNFFSSTALSRCKVSALSKILDLSRSKRMISECIFSETRFFTSLINGVIQNLLVFGDDEAEVYEIIDLLSLCMSKFDDEDDDRTIFLENLMSDSLKNIIFPTLSSNVWKYHSFVMFLVDEYFKNRKEEEEDSNNNNMKKIIYEVYGGHRIIYDLGVVKLFKEMEKKCPEAYFNEEFLKSEYKSISGNVYNDNNDDPDWNWNSAFKFPTTTTTTTNTTTTDGGSSHVWNSFDFSSPAKESTKSHSSSDVNSFTFRFVDSTEEGSDDDDDDDDEFELFGCQNGDEIWKDVF